jgi:hypothetical protein
MIDALTDRAAQAATDWIAAQSDDQDHYRSNPEAIEDLDEIVWDAADELGIDLDPDQFMSHRAAVIERIRS